MLWIMANKDFKSYLSQLEGLLETYLVKKAPALPTNIKEAVVNFAPWVTLVLMILTIPLVLAIFGLGAILAPFSFLGGVHVGVNYFVSFALSAVSLVMEALAIPGLFKKSQGGWKMVYYATLVGVLQNVINFNLGGLIIGSLLGLYLLFQVKSYYK